MPTTKEKVAMNLCYLTLGDSDLMSDIILEYVDLIDKNRLNDLLEYSNNEMRANVQSLYHSQSRRYVSLFQYVTNP